MNVQRSPMGEESPYGCIKRSGPGEANCRGKSILFMWITSIYGS